MRLRSFTAVDMPSVLKLVRDALGDDAIILSSENHPEKNMVTVTAAIEERDEDELFIPRKPVAPARVDAGLDELRHEVANILRFHNLPELFVAKIMQKATKSEPHYRVLLEKLLDGFYKFKPLDFKTPARLMLVGAPGIGKTLTVARIAARIALEKQKMTVITTDDKRAGGIEQLQAFTNILGVKLHVATDLPELRAAISSAPAKSHLLIDTAGCNPYDAGELRELASYAEIPGIEPVLAMQAGGDSLEAIDMAESFASLPVKRLLITRADTARRFGGVLAASAAHGFAFCNVSASSSIVDTLEPMDAALLAQLLLRYQLQS